MLRRRADVLLRHPAGLMLMRSARISAVAWADRFVEFSFFSMQTYLTDVWKLSFTHAAAFLNIWGAISRILPVFSLFLADACMGNFTMITVSSIACSVGICLVTLSTPRVLANLTGSCKEYEAQCIGQTQRGLFYTGMALLAVGTGGHRDSISPFLAEGNSDFVTLQLAPKAPILLVSSLTIIALFLAFPYIKQWPILFGVPGIFVVCATFIFVCGVYEYNIAAPQGSPLSDVWRVFVAAALKKSQPVPADTNHLYKKGDEIEGHTSFSSPCFLRWLEKAAIILPDDSVEDQLRNRWKRLCSVEEVESAKFVVRFIPIGTAIVMCTIVCSVGNTFLVEQGSHMNRKIGKWKVPSQILLALFYSGKYLFDLLAMRFVRICGPLFGIAVAMMFSILCCLTAAGIEIEGLKVVKDYDEATRMTAFWLIFPFFLLAGLSSFCKISVSAFYQNGSPNEAMTRYCSCFVDALSGLGLVYNVLSVYVVGKISEIGGGEGWFQYTLNKSRLDRYYWVLAGLSAFNLLVFIPLALLYNSYSWKTNEEVVEDE